jgi:hypothetical protein
MASGEALKPRIVVGRPARLSLLAVAVLTMHLALLRGLLPWHALEGAPRPPVLLRAVLTPPDPMRKTPAPSAARAAVAQAPARTLPRQHAATRAPLPARAPGDESLPVYPTRLPPPLHWRYAFVRNGQPGSAELDWRPGADAYAARFSAEAGGHPVLEWSSVGALDADGIAPQRHVDRRVGRGAQAANFRRDVARITYSGPSVEWPLPAGSQDRLSWMLQLAGIAAAAAPADRSAVRLFVSGARGDAEVWRFDREGPETIEIDGHPLQALKFIREPTGPYGLRIEAWLDPARHHMPVRTRWSNGANVWELRLAEEQAP